MPLVPPRSIAYQSPISTNQAYHVGADHAQSRFFNQSNGDSCNGNILQRSKDTGRMSQYYSQNFNENTSDGESDGQEHSMTQLLTQSQHRYSYTTPLECAIKYERQSSPDCAYYNNDTTSSQNVDAQIANDKWGNQNMNMGKRSNPFSNELDLEPKCARYGINDYHGNKEKDNQSCSVVAKTEINNS